MKLETHPRNIRLTDADKARLAREKTILTAEGPARDYRFINGVGTEYRVTATSAGNAILAFKKEHKIPSVPLQRLQIFENGVWAYVL